MFAIFKNREIYKFIFVGLLNTGLTYGVYIILLYVLPYSYSYNFSYILGIVFSFLLNNLFVFKTKVTLLKFIKYPIVYLTQFVLNWIFLFILVDRLAVDKRLAPLLVTLFSIPITFFLSRYILTDTKRVKG